MAAYAAVLSLFHTLNHIKSCPRPPISLDQQHLHSLTQNLTFFLDFFGCYYSEENDELESRIVSAAYAAEDVIESHIVDQIHAGSTSLRLNISFVDLYGGLERVIVDMDLIKKEAMEIMIEEKMKGSQHHHLHTNSSVSTASAGPASAGQSCIMARFDDALFYKVLDKLTGQQCGLQIIPIVGMGGIGKTTFANYIYSNPRVVEHFDILAWVTISQTYSRGNILQVLCQEVKGSINGLSEMSEDEIGLILYKHLWGRRYLIVMDDIWSVDAWYKVKSFFPDNHASRIMITTRLSNLAFELSGSHDFRLQFLDEDKSWDLLCAIVFGKLVCPIEYQYIGKEIATKCRGLPLSIVVIGGLLKKSNMTRAYWDYTLQNINSLINLDDGEYCLQILRTSYKELPIHLKPCFLHMGLFPEDEAIHVSHIIELWVVEGILRPFDGKSLEEVAAEYLKELIDRNLILVATLSWNGEARICNIHDLLRDVCLRETKKQKFLCVLRQKEHHTPQDIHMERRICIDRVNTVEAYSPQFLNDAESAWLTRTLLYRVSDDMDIVSPSLRFELLRVYSSVSKHTRNITSFNNQLFEQANLRYLSLTLKVGALCRLTDWCSVLWNLQTLKVVIPFTGKRLRAIASLEIWKLPLIRHVIIDRLQLPDPPNGEDNFVLENLQTLSCIINLKINEEVVKRIPNVKKLKVIYERTGVHKEEGLSNSCLNNLSRLQKLESFDLTAVHLDCCDQEILLSNLMSIPHSLKKLMLCGTQLYWEELTIRIGSLPLLQVLRLSSDACIGPKWETIEGQFCSLKFLQIEHCDLIDWETDSTHFPRIEYLVLQSLFYLEEIPSSVGDVPTLKLIRLRGCSNSAVDSVKIIKEEQEENGNEHLRVVIDDENDSDEDNSDKDFYSDEENQVGSNTEEDQVVSDI